MDCERNVEELMIDLDEMRKKRIVLFGAGKMAHNFLMLYENELPFAAIVDNNEALHGKRFYREEVKRIEGKR